MNLTITQDNTRTETINSSIIDKLYEIAFAASSDPNSTVSLTGRLESPKGYKFKIDWLNEEFSPDLTITVPAAGQYISFADSNVETVLKANNISSDGNGVTLADAAAVTTFNTMFKNNTDITSFDELQYFTNYTKVGLAGGTRYGDQGEFSGCSSLESIDLRNVDQIDGKFQGCSSLKEVKNFNGRFIISQQTYGSQFYDCTALESINLSNCMYLGSDVFRNCSSLSFIGDLKKIIWLNDGVFVGCTNLQIDIDMPLLGSRQFNNNDINVFYNSHINDAEGYRKNQDCIFAYSGILSISNLGYKQKLKNGTDYRAGRWNVGFASNCPNLTTVKLPKEMTYIGSYAFYGCPNLTSVKQYTDSIDDWVDGQTPTVGNLTGVTEFGSYCFANCPNLTLTPADIAGAVTLQNQAFKGSTLSGSIALPNLTTIGNSAFQNCTALHTVDLGANLTSVGQNAFGGSGITTFIFRSTTPPAYSGKFIDNMTGVTIYVPDAVVQDYQTAWPDMASNITGLTNYSAS